MRVACLGEGLLDLVCEAPASTPAEIGSFVPHVGGAMANAAVHVARSGAEVALCGGVGDDAWGVWIREQLEAEGVLVDALRPAVGQRTPLALVTVDDDGEPSYAIYGDAARVGLLPAAQDLPAQVASAGIVVVGSNSLIGEEERAVTMRARDAALAERRRLVVDVNLRPGRWNDLAVASERIRELAAEAFLLKVNLDEAELLSGTRDPAEAAARLRDQLARNVVVTMGEHGALLRGREGLSRDAPGVAVPVRCASGAGDAVTGVLVGALAGSAGYAPSLHVALPEAMRTAAEVVQRWSPV